MKPRVISFYEANGYMLKKLFEAGKRQGLKANLVYAGMEHVYNRARRGEKFRKIDLARLAFTAAHKIESTKYQKEFHDAMHSKKLLDNARAVIAELEERLRRKSFWAKFINWSQTGNFR